MITGMALELLILFKTHNYSWIYISNKKLSLLLTKTIELFKI